MAHPRLLQLVTFCGMTFDSPLRGTVSSPCCVCVGGETITPNFAVQSEADDAAVCCLDPPMLISLAYENSCDCFTLWSPEATVGGVFSFIFFPVRLSNCSDKSFESREKPLLFRF